MKRDLALSVLALLLFISANIAVNALDTPAEEPREVVVAMMAPERLVYTPAAQEEAKPSNPTPLSDELYSVLLDACEAHYVPAELALAVMEQESGFQEEAIGWDGHDIGLFQIRDSNHKWLTGETGADPLTPEGNIQCGVWLLGYLLGRYDTTEEALTAYRWGHDNGRREYAGEVLARVEKWSTQ